MTYLELEQLQIAEAKTVKFSLDRLKAFNEYIRMICHHERSRERSPTTR